jgi:CRP-like cAMP-binding protein
MEASELIAAPTFLRSLADGEREELLAAGRARGWEAGEVLIRRGDRTDSAIVILKGLAKIHTLTLAGTEVVLEFCGPGDLLGEISAVRDTERAATVTAIETVQAREIPVRSLRAFLTEHPRVTLSLLELAASRLQLSNARRIEFATSQSLARVAERLVELTERFGVRGQGAISVALPITQDELASWSGSSRESTGRALHTLRSLGLIETSRRRFTVLDIDGLRAHAPRL